MGPPGRRVAARGLAGLEDRDRAARERRAVVGEADRTRRFGVPVRAAVSVALVPTVSGPLVVVSVKCVGAAVPSSVWVNVPLCGA